MTSCAGIPPLVLVTGPEELLADRAVSSVVAALRETDPDLSVDTVETTGYAAGALALETAPSLFGGQRCVVVPRVDEAPEAVFADLIGYASDPAPDIVLVVVHRGGVRGKKALDALKKAGARVLECPAIKSDRDKNDFVVHEFRRAGRRVAPDAVRALIEAVGKDVRELAAACQQLIGDTEGVVGEAAVERYYGGKVEATGFAIADAAVAGQAGEALRLTRHALATGLDPVPIMAVLASQLRGLAKVSGAPRGPSAQLAGALNMAPWQIDRARRALQGWDDAGLGRAIQAVAAADFEVKGGGRDPVYAIERVIVEIARCRAGG